MERYRPSKWFGKQWNQLESKYQASKLHKRAVELKQEYKQTRNTATLDEAIEIEGQTTSLVPDHPDYLVNLAQCLELRYRSKGSLEDLEEAMNVLTHAVGANTEVFLPHQQFAQTLFLAYIRTGRSKYLEDGNVMAQRAMNTCCDPIYQPSVLFVIHNGLHLLYTKNDSISTLEEAIDAIRKAHEMQPNNVTYLSTLYTDLHHLYTHFRELSELEEVIQLARKLIAAAPNDPEQSKWRFQLGRYLHELHKHTGNPDHLDEAKHHTHQGINIIREKIDAVQHDKSKMAELLHSLSLSLRNWCICTKDPKDILEAVRTARHSVDLTPHCHPQQVARLMTLSGCLQNWSEEVGTMAELQNHITVVRQVPLLAPNDFYEEERPLCIFAFHLHKYYSLTRTMSYLDEGISISRKIVSGLAEDHRNLPNQLEYLLVMLGSRHAETRALDDMKESVELGQRLVDLTPDDSPRRPRRLLLLADCKNFLSQREGNEADLTDAIAIARSVIEATPKNDRSWPHRAESLSLKLRNLFMRTGGELYLQEAIEWMQDVIKANHEDSDRLSSYLAALSSMLDSRYELTKNMGFLNEAIETVRKAIILRPNEGIRRTYYLNTLADFLLERWLQTTLPTDFDEAVAISQSVIDREKDTRTNHAELLRAGRKLATLFMSSSNWERAFSVLAQVTDQIPSLIPRSLETSDKQYVLGFLLSFAIDAATAAMRLGKDPFVALEMLERGRGVLGTSLEEMRRTDIDEFRQAYPELADRFAYLRSQLEQSGNAQHPLSKELLGLTLEDNEDQQQTLTDQRYNAGNKLTELIDEIRQLPGFEGLFDSPSEAEMRNAASQGPIVVINVSMSHCDAIIVEQHQIRALPLEELTWETIKYIVENEILATSDTLEWLWDTALDPILTALGYTEAVTDDNWPHVWWIPTGLLSKLPIHAAGYHAENEGRTVLDRVMSSYGSSIKAIINGRRRHVEMESNNALLADIRNAGLPFATKEIQMLGNLCTTMLLEPTQPERHRQEMLQALQDCRIFHFAGHGYTHATDPSKSHLRLEGGHNDVLTVADLLEINLHKRPPFLAYLSACGTGQIKADGLIDESIHLISGCQLAGFRHVIGTLWEVNDAMCVDMARIIYQTMGEGGMTDESVCKGLHNASRKLRDRWVFETDGIYRGAGSVREYQPPSQELEDLQLDDAAVAAKKLKVAMQRDQRMLDEGPQWAVEANEQRAGTRSVKNSRANRLAATEDSDDEEEEESGEPLWAPYVHYGI